MTNAQLQAWAKAAVRATVERCVRSLIAQCEREAEIKKREAERLRRLGR